MIQRILTHPGLKIFFGIIFFGAELKEDMKTRPFQHYNLFSYFHLYFSIKKANDFLCWPWGGVNWKYTDGIKFTVTVHTPPPAQKCPSKEDFKFVYFLYRNKAHSKVLQKKRHHLNASLSSLLLKVNIANRGVLRGGYVCSAPSPWISKIYGFHGFFRSATSASLPWKER